MNGEQLLQLARVYQENQAFITNEETAKMSLVVPFIRLLGYDPNIPREVRLEYAAEFTQGDGKRLPDRMDFAIFDRSGSKPLIVIETKPIGTDLRSKAQQLARYIAQLPNLHFGIITDGCNYLFYGDLESSNVMDKDPFFRFTLDDSNTNWDNVAAFLTKFSRDSFNANDLLTDAENSRYRQAMIDKIVRVLRSPSRDDQFMKWLTKDIYKGKRTESIRSRMGRLADEAIEPAILRFMGNEMIEHLKERIQVAQKLEDENNQELEGLEEENLLFSDEVDPELPDRKKVITTEEEIQFYEIVKKMVADSGYEVEKVIYRDTVNYFNVSYRRPTKWFVRFFGSSKRKSIITLVPTERAIELVNQLEVEDAPTSFGVSRVYIEGLDQIADLKPIIIESLELLTDE